MNIVIFVVSLLLNYWVWRIFKIDFLVGSLCVTASVFLYLYLQKSKKFLLATVLAFMTLFILQSLNTNKVDLVNFSNDQVRIRDMRLREYPPLRLPIAYWFEQRKEFVAYFRIKNNLSEALDLNLYFFANYPRGRVGIEEFEKFPFIYLPVFVFGILSLIKSKKYLFITLSFVLPLFLLGVISNRSLMGGFVLFPFFVLTIAEGGNYLWGKWARK